MNGDPSRRLDSGAGGENFLLNLLGQMVRLPMSMLAASAGWATQIGQGMQQAVGGAPRSRNGWQVGAPDAGRQASAGPANDPDQAAAGTVRNQEGRMQVLVVFEVFHSIVEPQRFQQAITQTHDQLNLIFASGTVVASGAFSAKRGGFLVLNVASGEELLRLLAPGLSDNCTIEVSPVLSFESQGEVLRQIGLK